jgi:uncharacterized membrane protein
VVTKRSEAADGGQPPSPGSRSADRGFKGWIQDHLAWSTLYRAVSYSKSALWVVPILAGVLERLLFRVLQRVEPLVTWQLIDLGVDGAKTLFQTVITLTLSFIIFTFGSLLVAIQVASGQLTPRIIATTLLRDRAIKYVVGLNVFSLLFAITALNRTEGTVLQLSTFLAAILGLGCLAAFLFLIDYTARLLRPVRIVALVCDEGMDVVRAVYPRSVQEPKAEGVPVASRSDAPARTMTHDRRSQIVLAVDIESLVAAAKRVDGLIELVPQVGDFVAADEPLFNLYGEAATVDDDLLRAAVAFGSERTMEQDPMFSFRILVDIALKALSPAINDPTTAVLAIDQIHRLLRFVGKRRLHDDTVHDADGQPRLILRTPNWEDFVHIACCEIRACGANNVQIARRMRAMLENLVLSLPPTRHAALKQQLDLLDRTLPDHYKLPEDLALARIPDSQGLGASGGTRAR